MQAYLKNQFIKELWLRSTSVLWHIPYPGGEPRIILPESPQVSYRPTYGGVSINASSDMLVSTAGIVQLSISIASIEDPTRIEQTSTGYFYRTWTPDGRIVYMSLESRNEDLWIMDQDGRNRKQLTSGPGLSAWPVPSPDGRYIVFISNRSGGAGSIWRMDMDGGNQTQLTDIGGGPDVSPDGRWVIYRVPKGQVRTLWKVSIDGGKPEQLTDQDEGWPAISPDGKLIAYHYKGKQTDTDRGIAIMPFEGGPPLKQFELSVDFNWLSRSRWTPDGRGIMHIRTKGGVSNLWIQPIDGGPSKQMTSFKSNTIEWFDLSPDRQLISYTIFAASNDILLISSVENE